MGRGRACVPFDYSKFVALLTGRGMKAEYLAVDLGHQSDYWKTAGAHKRHSDDGLHLALTKKTAEILDKNYGITPDMYAPDQPKEPERVPEQMTLEIQPDPQDVKTVLTENVRLLNQVNNLVDLMIGYKMTPKILIKEAHSLNRVILIGRLCADPEIRTTTGGKKVARYRLAVDRRTKGEDKTADYITCIAWEGRADFAEKYLKKGTKIAISGRIQTGSYDDRDGKKVYTTDVIVDDCEFCESKATASAGAVTAGDYVPADIDEELPFK